MQLTKMTTHDSKILFVFFLSLSLISSVLSVSQQELEEAKQLIDAKTSCDSLSEDQLEIIGEFLMEQMHPGKNHEFMDNMMGLQDGSKEDMLFHTNLGRVMYCGDNSNAASLSGMNRMFDMMEFDMMTNMEMMGNSRYRSDYSTLLNILYIILLIGLIALVYLGIAKLWIRKSARK